MSWIKTILHGARTGSARGVRVLAVMPKDSDGQTLARIATRAGWDLEFNTSYESAVHLLKREPVPVILVDKDLTIRSSWREAIEKFAREAPDSSIILTSRENDDHLWQEVIRLGGYDVLTKPFQEDRVLRSIRFAWSSRNP